ncbi:hypothetical protein [Marinobacterium rhizophilum]|uniref:hypothetical protein n=1 Tax=Marinobacterium rhizophilum TaxID=420402 RepID=UPI000372A8E9|nr:hypothetical protein [Marinobacterium rhizophilum]
MDERVRNIKTPEKCEIFAKNCADRGRDDLALEAKQWAVQLRAEAYGAESEVEKEAVSAIYAYEEVLSARNGKKTRASSTWQLIKRHGIISAVDRALNRPADPEGYDTLVDMGLADYALEAVIVRNPETFSDSAVKISQDRIKQWTCT